MTKSNSRRVLGALGRVAHVVKHGNQACVFQPAHGVFAYPRLRRLAGFEQSDSTSAFATDAVKQSKVVLAGNVQGLGYQPAFVPFG
jgi:hypothetical protein